MQTKSHIVFCILLSLGTANATTVLTLGHADFDIHFDGNLALRHHAKAGATINGSTVLGADTNYEAADLVVFVPNATNNRPVGSQYDFIGVGAGVPFWTLPEIQEVNKPFYGVSAGGLDPVDWDGSLNLALLSVVSAPSGGQFSLWQDNGGSPIVRLATSNGVNASDTFEIVPGSHQHYNWSFTEPGIYQLQFKVIGYSPGDPDLGFGGLEYDSIETFTFQVAPEPSKILLSALGFGWVLIRRRRHVKC